MFLHPIDLLKETSGHSLQISVIFEHFLHPIYNGIEHVLNKDFKFRDIFNIVTIEFLKNLSLKEDTLRTHVIPFVNKYNSFGLNQGALRGLVHR